MATGMRFRKQCARCGKTFFTPNRGDALCQRCLKIHIEEKRKLLLKRRKVGRKGGPPGHDEGSPSGLSPTLRAALLQAYGVLRARVPNMPMRQVHLILARRFRLQGAVIATFLREERDRALLTDEVRRQIVARYLAYVEQMVRPATGRRKSIARELQIPFRQVAKIVRDWKDQQPRTSEIPRAVRFEMEKSYFQLLAQGRGLREIGEVISKEMGFTLWQVLRYLDLIHNGERILRKVPDVSPNERRRIEEGYREYLSGSTPPEPFLHESLAQRVGVHPKQVHKVLLDYRLQFLKDHLDH